MSSPDTLSPQHITDNISSLPVMPEDYEHPIPSFDSENIFTTDSSQQSTSSLSSKQVQEVLQQVTKQLELHRKFTPELVKLLEIGKPASNISTSSTPSDHPTLLSSDKMSNIVSAPKRFTIQQIALFWIWVF
jgi:hypothetical protein